VKNLFFNCFILICLILLVGNISKITAILFAVIFVFIYIIIEKKVSKSVFMILILVPFLFHSLSFPTGECGILGKVIDKRNNKYTIISKAYFQNDSWYKHRNYYIFYYSNFSVEDIYTGKNVFIKGYMNENFINVEYVAPASNNSILFLKDYAVNRMSRNIENPISRDILISSIMGNLKDKELFKNTGTLHLFAVSGMHVFIIYFIISFIINQFIIQRDLRLIVSSSIIIFYLIFTGFSPSSVRAVSILVLMNIFRVFDINVSSFNILGLVGIINLFIIPESVLNTGFQMSYAATFMILYTVKKVKNKKILFFLIPICSFIGIFPFSIIQFGEISFLGILLTPLLSPVLTLIMFTSFLILIFPINLFTKIGELVTLGTVGFLKIFENIPLLKSENIFLILFFWSLSFILYIYFINKFNKNTG